MASGKMQNLTDIKRLHAAITADAHTDDISFVTALLAPSLSRSFRIPRGISLKGNFHADGPRYAADFTASQGGGSVKGDARFDMKGYAYRARLTANSLRLANFLPDLAVEPFTGELTAEEPDSTSSRDVRGWKPRDAYAISAIPVTTFPI